MPIRPELRHHYRGPAWRATRARILARAGGCCEACLVRNWERVLRVSGWWIDESRSCWMNPVFDVKAPGVPFACVDTSKSRLVRIILTIAHLNHVAGDDRDENLKALCQWCHLHYDSIEHARHARVTRQTLKDEGRPLLALAAVAS